MRNNLGVNQYHHYHISIIQTHLNGHGVVKHCRNVVNFSIPNVKAGIINRKLVVCCCMVADVSRLYPRHIEPFHSFIPRQEGLDLRVVNVSLLNNSNYVLVEYNQCLCLNYCLSICIYVSNSNGMINFLGFLDSLNTVKCCKVECTFHVRND